MPKFLARYCFLPSERSSFGSLPSIACRGSADTPTAGAGSTALSAEACACIPDASALMLVEAASAEAGACDTESDGLSRLERLLEVVSQPASAMLARMTSARATPLRMTTNALYANTGRPGPCEAR